MMQIIYSAARHTVIQLLVVIGPGLILTLLMSRVSAWFAGSACRVLGKRGYLLIIGWPGIAVHELSHALAAILFGHKISNIRLLEFHSGSGRVGHVSHRYNPDNPYQRVGNLFIGIAPVILGAFVIMAAAWFLVPKIAAGLAAKSLPSAGDLPAFLFHAVRVLFDALFDGANYHRVRFYIFLYILFSVGSAMTLSRADLAGARSGLVVFLVLIFAGNLLNVWHPAVFRLPPIVISDIYRVYVLMILVMLTQVVLAGPFFLVAKKSTGH